MIVVLALIVSLMSAGSASAATRTNSYTAWIKDGQVHMRFYDLAHVYGPFHLYVSPNASPKATACSDCPDVSTSADCEVLPGMIYQSWPFGGKCVEIRFPLSAVQDMQSFYFTAATCIPGAERYLTSGSVPH